MGISSDVSYQRPLMFENVRVAERSEILRVWVVLRVVGSLELVERSLRAFRSARRRGGRCVRFWGCCGEVEGIWEEGSEIGA